MNNPLSIIADVAERYVGIKEVSPNQAPELQQFWNSTNYTEGMKNREPWCAAFVSFCVQQADKESASFKLTVPPRFSAVAQFVEWANKKTVPAILFGNALRDGYIPMRGDLVSLIPWISHIGIVTGYDPKTGTVYTVEGNTNKAGSREGDGVYVKERSINRCGCFIRCAVSPETV